MEYLGGGSALDLVREIIRVNATVFIFVVRDNFVPFYPPDTAFNLTPESYTYAQIQGHVE